DHQPPNPENRRAAGLLGSNRPGAPPAPASLAPGISPGPFSSLQRSRFPTFKTTSSQKSGWPLGVPLLFQRAGPFGSKHHPESRGREREHDDVGERERRQRDVATGAQEPAGGLREVADSRSPSGL